MFCCYFVAPEKEPFWVVNREEDDLTEDKPSVHLPMSPTDIPALAKKHNLLTTEESFLLAAKYFEALPQVRALQAQRDKSGLSSETLHSFISL